MAPIIPAASVTTRYDTTYAVIEQLGIEPFVKPSDTSQRSNECVIARQFAYSISSEAAEPRRIAGLKIGNFGGIKLVETSLEVLNPLFRLSPTESPNQCSILGMMHHPSRRTFYSDQYTHHGVPPGLPWPSVTPGELGLLAHLVAGNKGAPNHAAIYTLAGRYDQPDYMPRPYARFVIDFLQTLGQNESDGAPCNYLPELYRIVNMPLPQLSDGTTLGYETKPDWHDITPFALHKQALDLWRQLQSSPSAEIREQARAFKNQATAWTHETNSCASLAESVQYVIAHMQSLTQLHDSMTAFVEQHSTAKTKTNPMIPGQPNANASIDDVLAWIQEGSRKESVKKKKKPQSASAQSKKITADEHNASPDVSDDDLIDDITWASLYTHKNKTKVTSIPASAQDDPHVTPWTLAQQLWGKTHATLYLQADTTLWRYEERIFLLSGNALDVWGRLLASNNPGTFESREASTAYHTYKHGLASTAASVCDFMERDVRKTHFNVQGSLYDAHPVIRLYYFQGHDGKQICIHTTHPKKKGERPQWLTFYYTDPTVDPQRDPLASLWHEKTRTVPRNRLEPIESQRHMHAALRILCPQPANALL